MIFEDRMDAGKQLAEKLADIAQKDGVVLAIPRGGVVVGAEIAKKFGLKMDIIIPRKIGSPGNPEAAIGAVAQDGTTIIDSHLIERMGISESELKNIVSSKINEIKRRMLVYVGNESPRNYKGKQLIVADDGVATGYTMVAALRSVRNYQPGEIVLSVPVAPPDVLLMLEKEVDRVVCLYTPETFYGVGQFYRHFEQTSDEEVINILRCLKRE